MKKIFSISLILCILSIISISCSHKKYDLRWEGDKLIIEMPKPIVSNWGWGPNIDWQEVKIKDIPSDVYTKLKKERNKNRVELVVRFVKKDNDKYGNSSVKTKDYSLGVFDPKEVNKYHDKDYFNSNYHLDRKIEDIVLKPHRDIENGIKKPSSQIGNMKFYNMDDDWD